VRDTREITSNGQTAGDDTTALARAAAEAVRGLNHATRHRAGPGRPAVACDVIGALSMAASRTGQALTQITRHLDRALAAGQLGHDLGDDPAHAVNSAAAFLAGAATGAAAMADDLNQAQQQLALINGRPGGPGAKEQS
jgi:hypothetical protein